MQSFKRNVFLKTLKKKKPDADKCGFIYCLSGKILRTYIFFLSLFPSLLAYILYAFCQLAFISHVTTASRKTKRESGAETSWPLVICNFSALSKTILLPISGRIGDFIRISSIRTSISTTPIRKIK